MRGRLSSLPKEICSAILPQFLYARVYLTAPNAPLALQGEAVIIGHQDLQVGVAGGSMLSSKAYMA
ncbi:hypothetical protein Pyn_19861 [Prunus yedoensis var. nudiflora]|uniref:Uncharacterized protein n=1 Tax=Prunus yedoensis var. nudiflora TaxID=2094558 RepID=A0A314ZTZ8_PRUYE|nr:hypothetical protein Pyn_19861 [Prunus yedoensis var. nudiflora]